MTTVPYLEINDLIARFGEQEVLAAFEAESRNTLPQQAVEQRVESATALINAYIGARYAIPLVAPVPELIRRIAAAIIRYDYHTLENRERVDAPYREALRALRDIRDGKIDLAIAQSPSPNRPRFSKGGDNA